MKKKNRLPYILLICALLLLPFLPKMTLSIPLFSHTPLHSQKESYLERENIFLKEEVAHLCALLENRHHDLQSTSARVIYREPALWSSYLWINVGRKHNVVEGSPVLFGGALVGVIENVEKRKSQVRLITDADLVPSVRVVRGDEKSCFLMNHLDVLVEHLPDEQPLQDLKERLMTKAGNRYLAKGEVMGTALPLWRCRSQRLKGVGFNYDFADEHGPARDLYTGRPYDGGDGLALIEKGDLLVTTGMDGLFPPGLHVGIVTSVTPPVEGGTAYDVEVSLAAGTLDTLTTVSVINPYGRSL